MDHPSLEGKVAIVTGGAMGMGEATARLFAEAGARVLLADRERGDRTAGRVRHQSFGRYGGVSLPWMCPVPTRIKGMVEAVVATFGRLDVAVNNAAVTPDTHQIHELDEDEFDNIIAINLRGVALCMKYEIARLIEQGDKGSIVNISSVNGFRPQFNSTAYTASKHAVIGMTKVAALENGGRGIRVNAVAPGAIETPMLRGAVERSGGSLDASAAVLTLFNRLGRPEEVAQASLWLASDLSSFVTGETLCVDAGYTNR